MAEVFNFFALQKQWLLWLILWLRLIFQSLAEVYFSALAESKLKTCTIHSHKLHFVKLAAVGALEQIRNIPANL
ncbi:hypothetical protein [Pontibacter arcticus]|uniref:Uncharacterized protein n=1 Tax=Pontibacter arcticus TaxID=2080288 RepID=A0A364RDS7_9BACT|nr:hypothetical protein [Pontibacter arcticus]RAU82471.1 hypothetical protein DP923_11850 [Pontibacter arcticus]